jgi:hypothetical protein
MNPVFRAPMRTRLRDAPPGSGADYGVARGIDRPFGEPEVPAGVAATFGRGGRNFQRTQGDAVERRTAELWAAARP